MKYNKGQEKHTPGIASDDWKNPGGGLTLLPPAPDKCPECAASHKPQEPHNQQSLYYQMRFRILHGRDPTWEDAMAHCDEQTKKFWREELVKEGAKR